MRLEFILKALFAIAVVVFFCGTAIAQTLPVYQRFYTIESQSPDGLTLTFEFNELNIQNAGSNNSNTKVFEIPGLSYNYVNGMPLLPVLALPLTLPDTSTTVKVNVDESVNYPGYYPVLFQDEPNDPMMETARASQNTRTREKELQAFKSVYPNQIFELEEMGLFRDYQLTALRVYPLQVTGNGVKFNKKFTIRILFEHTQSSYYSVPSGESEILNKFVVNKNQINLVSPKAAPVPASPPKSPAQKWNSLDPEFRVRLVVDEKGIYQVTGQDLQNAGVDLNSIDPATLRMMNKGHVVAFYMAGDQDNQFDPNDFLEFWGERNEQTFIDQYPDQYSDPFSNENVYWLEWGGDPGLRMVEENGSLIASQPGTYNPSFFYSTTVHVEQNNHFERLGMGSTKQLSYKRDLWFFDAGVRAIGKKQYPFELIYPDESSFRSVYVTVMLSGRSFNNHNVMIWLNNGFVGSSAAAWRGQDTSRVTNLNSSSLRTTNLNHGENLLEVQLPSLSGNETDIVLLNWFDVTYDRLYKAHRDQIEFKRPGFIPYPNTDLFQFDIDNFTRPDIDIYKKGISKIVNYRLESETINDTLKYKISFQDQVPVDDIEYIAIAENHKKKPLRIEPDEPFDPQNPQRFLKDPNNTAEYLIITHSRFYENAVELRDYRRGQGVSAECVNVQDIYDEFNFGIKSPLAIQEFLRYAFFNWSRNPRLAYVVLLGNANFNYKTKSLVARDFVPTFFYQTQEFGAAATDFPYALVSGNDQIPDLFIGRIPAASNSDARNVIDKIIEFENSTPASAWKNQALFISGNDRSTYELSTWIGNVNPAFRSQNTRLIKSILPNHLSAIRLNTVRDPNLPFDPNFGSTSDLRDHFEDGLFWINFMGHGGGGIWADVQLMDLSDVDNLNNKGMYPIVTSMTCFTGAFENPGKPGLAQKLLLAPEKGAIGVFASSGLGYLHNDYAILWNLGQFMFDRSLSVGEIITLGTILYWNAGYNYATINGNNYGTPGFGQVRYEMVYQYNLFGDPYVKLQYSSDELTIEPGTATPQRGDTLDVAINSNLSIADGYLELVDEEFNIADRIPLFGVSQTSTTQLTIPDSFPEGTGYIRAYLSDGSRDAGGEAAIGVNHAVVTSVIFQPENPNVDDSVYVHLMIKDEYGIQAVFLLPQGGADTVVALPDPGDPAHFTARMEPTGQLRTVTFDVHVKNNVGNTSIIRGLSYTVTDIRPDIAALPGSVKFTGLKKTRLKAGIENIAGAGNDNSVKVNVYFADGSRNFQSGIYFASTQVTLSAADSASVTVDFPLSLERSEYQFYVRAEVDPSEALEDFNPGNNTINQRLAPTLFNVTPAQGSDTIVVKSRYRVYFPPGSVSDSTAVKVALEEFLPPQDQAGLKPVAVQSQSTFHALDIRLMNPNAAYSGSFRLNIQLDPSLRETRQNHQISEITLYEKLGPTQPWTSTQFSANPDNNQLLATLQKNARYAPFISTDVKAPLIELTAEGRPLQESGLVSNKPSLYVIVQDESGINLQKEKIGILLDDKPLPGDKVFIPDSVQKNNVLGITLYPDLNQGKHQLEISVQDVNGNSSTKDFQLVVSDGFDIHVYGNYPNPFKDQTRFAYFVDLNDDLDEFEIRIYTVSGRLIKKIDSDEHNLPNAIDGGARRKGYNELIWYGTDRDGTEVANGVYFAVVRGTYEGETIEKILKVAKLR